MCHGVQETRILEEIHRIFGRTKRANRRGRYNGLNGIEVLHFIMVNTGNVGVGVVCLRVGYNSRVSRTSISVDEVTFFFLSYFSLSFRCVWNK